MSCHELPLWTNAKQSARTLHLVSHPTARHIMQPIRQLGQRMLRYADTIGWLLVHQIRSGPWLYIVTLVTGITSKLGNIIVLAITIKCAHWLLIPTEVPEKIRILFSSIPNGLLISCIMAPGITMIAVSIGTAIHAKLARTTSFITAKKIIIDQDRISSTEDRQKDTVNNLPYYFPRIYKASTSLLQLTILATTITCVAAVGWILNPWVTVTIFVIAMPLVAALILSRHRTQTKLAAPIDLNLAVSNEEKLEVKNSSSIEQSVEAIFNKHSTRDRTNSSSRLVIDVGQGLLLFVLMIALHTEVTTTDANAISNAIILIILMRFAVAQLKTLSTQALALSGFYHVIYYYRANSRQPK